MDAYYNQVQERLTRIEDKLDAISEFKAQAIISARFTSVIVSAVLGFVSLVSSSVLAFVITTKLNK